MKIKEELRKQVYGIFDEIGLQDLSDEEKETLQVKIMDQFDKVIIETMLMCMNDDQVAEFKKILEGEDEEEIEVMMTELASNIPGLSANLDMAIRNEWETIKKAMTRVI